MVSRCRKSSGLILICLICGLASTSGFRAEAQTLGYNYFYRIYFTDKGTYNTGTFRAPELLSNRAIARRIRYGIIYPDYYDLPVYGDYLKQVSQAGLVLHCTSKWMNTGLFKSVTPVETALLENLPFVSRVLLVKKPGLKNSQPSKLDLSFESTYIHGYDNPLVMINGIEVQNSGFRGEGVVIAVLDGGFYRANTISSLSLLRARNGIKGTRDFILKSDNVYGYHNHGTAVLSVLAGDVPGYIQGSAPGALFWLFRTEDVSSEFPVEEDFWAAAAEFADSIGADVISSSLGYSTFDDPEMDYKFTDMNGSNAFVTRAADIAASKGILVVSSAGNERNKPWLRIVAPSDGKSVLSAGAVDANNNIASFSSAGPSADSRVKPDNVAQGVAVTLQVYDTVFSQGSGTSFSCPVLSGMGACILQAVPQASPSEIINALHKSGDKAEIPDSLYGYGLPDIRAAIDTLQKKLLLKNLKDLTLWPNPFTDCFDIFFSEPPGVLRVEIFSQTGQKIYTKSYINYISRTLRINEMNIREQGIYFVRITTGNTTKVLKTVKLAH